MGEVIAFRSNRPPARRVANPNVAGRPGYAERPGRPPAGWRHPALLRTRIRSRYGERWPAVSCVTNGDGSSARSPRSPGAPGCLCSTCPSSNEAARRRRRRCSAPHAVRSD